MKARRCPLDLWESSHCFDLWCLLSFHFSLTAFPPTSGPHTTKGFTFICVVSLHGESRAVWPLCPEALQIHCGIQESRSLSTETGEQPCEAKTAKVSAALASLPASLPPGSPLLCRKPRYGTWHPPELFPVQPCVGPFLLVRQETQCLPVPLRHRPFSSV